MGFDPFSNRNGTATSQLPDLPLEMRQDFPDYSQNTSSLNSLPASKQSEELNCPGRLSYRKNSLTKKAHESKTAINLAFNKHGLQIYVVKKFKKVSAHLNGEGPGCL